MGLSFSTLNHLSNANDKHQRSGHHINCDDGIIPGNPGTFDEIHKKFDDIVPKHFEGARVALKKRISRNFFATHAIVMSPKVPWIPEKIKEDNREQGYKFGVSYEGTKMVGPRERYPHLYGDVRPNGDLMANVVHTLGCRCRVKLAAKVKNCVYENVKSTIEYRTDDCTLGVTLVDPVIMKQQGVIVFQYLQAISSRLTLGVELAHNEGRLKNLSDKQTNAALAFRYSTGFRTLSTTLGQTGMRICYHHRQSHNLQMGIEGQMSFLDKVLKTKVVCQINAPMYDMRFQGCIDSDARIGAVFEKKLCPITESSLLLSFIMDHAKQDVSAGIGLHIGY